MKIDFNLSKKEYLNFKDIHKVFLLSLYVLLIGSIYFFFTDISILATSWLKDDAFYYLKTAQQFSTYHFFTFDGINYTYGFQPFYELVLSLLAYIIKGKILFVKMTLFLSLSLYVFSACLIYLVGKSFLNNRWAIIPSLLWLSNIDLLNIFTSGMENAVAVFVLLLLLYLLNRILNNKYVFIIGALTGILILTRVNLIFTIPIFIIYLNIVLKKQSSNSLINKNILYLIGVFTTILPWAIYSIWQFNTLFPNSGTRKLIGSFAALLRIFSNILPQNITNNILHFLPKYESSLYFSHIKLPHPEIFSFIKYILGFLPSVVLSFGHFYQIKSFYQPHEKILMFVLIILIVIISIIALNYLLKCLKKQNKRLLNIDKNKYFPLIILSVISIVNIILNGTLLPRQLTYSTWYSFPEILLYTYFITIIIKNIYNFLKVSFPNSYLLKKHVYIMIILFSIIFSNLTIKLIPNTPYHYDSFLVEAWKAKDWLNSHTENTNIGAWSSGILGYFTKDNDKVINLDGLANSPLYTEKIYSNYVLFSNKLTKNNLIWDYIKDMHIKYIADADFISNKTSNYFLSAIPPKYYELIYQSGVINWKESLGDRTFKIIRLNY